MAPALQRTFTVLTAPDVHNGHESGDSSPAGPAPAMEAKAEDVTAQALPEPEESAPRLHALRQLPAETEVGAQLLHPEGSAQQLEPADTACVTAQVDAPCRHPVEADLGVQFLHTWARAPEKSEGDGQQLEIVEMEIDDMMAQPLPEPEESAPRLPCLHALRQLPAETEVGAQLLHTLAPALQRTFTILTAPDALKGHESGDSGPAGTAPAMEAEGDGQQLKTVETEDMMAQPLLEPEESAPQFPRLHALRQLPAETEVGAQLPHTLDPPLHETEGGAQQLETADAQNVMAQPLLEPEVGAPCRHPVEADLGAQFLHTLAPALREPEGGSEQLETVKMDDVMSQPRPEPVVCDPRLRALAHLPAEAEMGAQPLHAEAPPLDDSAGSAQQLETDTEDAMAQPGLDTEVRAKCCHVDEEDLRVQVLHALAPACHEQEDGAEHLEDRETDLMGTVRSVRGSDTTSRSSSLWSKARAFSRAASVWAFWGTLCRRRSLRSSKSE